MQRLSYYPARLAGTGRFRIAQFGVVSLSLSLVGCGGSGTNSSPGHAEIEGTTVTQISGLAQTTDASLSANSSLVPVSGATITVINSATGKQAGQATTPFFGAYDIGVPEGVYSVVPSPVTVGSVTLVAPTQQVAVKLVGHSGAQIVPILYTRQ